VYLLPESLPYGATGWPNLSGYNPIILTAGLNEDMEVDPAGVAGATWGFMPNPAEVPLAYVDATLPALTTVNTPTEVSVWAAPVNATLPITFTVSADDLDPIIQVVNEITADFTLEWPQPGWKLVTISADNAAGPSVETERWIEVGAPVEGADLDMADQALVWHGSVVTASVTTGSWPFTYTLNTSDGGQYVKVSDSLAVTFLVTPTVSGEFTVTLAVENAYGATSVEEPFWVWACPEWLGVTQTYTNGDEWAGFCGDDNFNAAAEAAGVVGEIELDQSETLGFWANPYVHTTGGTFWAITPENTHNVEVSPGLNQAFFDSQGISPSRWGYASNPGAASHVLEVFPPLADPKGF
jgi:hypothetical protein